MQRRSCRGWIVLDWRGPSFPLANKELRSACATRDHPSAVARNGGPSVAAERCGMPGVREPTKGSPGNGVQVPEPEDRTGSRFRKPIRVSVKCITTFRD